MSKKVLFICTGNTCRSPMAAEIYNILTNTKDACSAGIFVNLPQKAAENAIEVIKDYGGNLDNHISSQVSLKELEDADIIITMTASHKKALLSYTESSKIITLAEFAGEKEDVPDPFGGSIELYRKTAGMIFEYIKKGLLKSYSCQLAQNEDLTAIIDIERETFSDCWSENAIKAELLKERILVCKDRAEILGYCIFMIAADEGEILRIAVKSSARKKGIGKKLLSHVIEMLEGTGCSEVFLEVRQSNTPAISLYKSLGFKETGIRKGYYSDNKENAVLFNLKIKER